MISATSSKRVSIGMIFIAGVSNDIEQEIGTPEIFAMAGYEARRNRLAANSPEASAGREPLKFREGFASKQSPAPGETW